MLKSQLNRTYSKPGLIMPYDEKLQRPLKRRYRGRHFINHVCSGIGVLVWTCKDVGGIDVGSGVLNLQLLAMINSSLSLVESISSMHCLVAWPHPGRSTSSLSSFCLDGPSSLTQFS